jgi:hypothetical protein
MPSIPQSLLWISLVVLWLFVLVPMLISKRDTVRRTSDVALAARVVNTRRGARLLRRRGPAAGHFSDPHWAPEEDPSDLEYEGDDDVSPSRKTVVRAAATVTGEPDYLDVDVVELDSGALPVGGVAAQQPELPLDLGLDDKQDDLDEPAPVASAEAHDDSTAAIRTVTEVDFDESPDGAADEYAADEYAADEYAADEYPEAGYDSEPDGTDHEYEYVDDTSGLEASAEAEGQAPESMSQARRRRYESATAAAVSARKYKFRKRMLLAMGTALLASALIASLLTPTMWWVCGTVGAVTVLYLGYLRRQTRIEERVRRRRAQRMARSRLGVENTRDGEFDVVPARLRRPGSVVLEIDDEDPIFEHLDYATSEEYHLARASGQ